MASLARERSRRSKISIARKSRPADRKVEGRKRKAIPSFMGEDYEKHWGCFSFEGKTILDIGADYGSTASFFLEKGAKKVFAVESDPAFFRKLVSNFTRRPEVVTVRLEVSEPRHFEELIRRFKPDMLKTDCEGCEIQLARSNTETLRLVPEYLIETHEHAGIKSRQKVENLFDRMGYVRKTYEVLPGPLKAQIVHAKRDWARVNLPEDEIVQLRNAASLHAANLTQQTNALRTSTKRLGQIKKSLQSDPLSFLLYLYSTRTDLRKTYPEVRNGNYKRLLEWANEVIKDRKDEFRRLSRFATWYRRSTITSLKSLPSEISPKTEQTNNAKDETVPAIDWPNALSNLVGLYNSRKDLRTAFPEAARGDEKNLIRWAARIVLGEGHDDDVSTLRPYGTFYVSVASQNELKEVRTTLKDVRTTLKDVRNELAPRSEQINGLNNELAIKKEELDDLREQLSLKSDEVDKLNEELSLKSTEVSKIRNELNESETRLKATSLDIDNLRVRLVKTQGEIEEVRRSFGYELMRSYGPKLDRLFPVGTRRRELKNIMARSARITVEEGVGSLPGRIWRKLKKRQLKVTAPAVQLEPTGQLEEHTVQFQESKSLAEEQAAPGGKASTKQVLGSCDYPPLSHDSVARVASSFMVAGWALSQEGIDRVDVYLDDLYAGPAICGVDRPDIIKAYPAISGAEKSGFTKLISIDEEPGKTHRLKIVATTRAKSSLTLEGNIAVHESVLVEAPLGETQLGQTGPTSSVIILTRNPPPDFEQTLQGLRRQVGIADPEIIIINSGDSDLSDLSERYRAKVLSISAQEFEHSGTRNLGAEKATTNYVFYLADDAIPAGDQLLSGMIELMENDKNVAAATARQIPRSDSDLMSCQALWGHYNMLNLAEDRVVGTTRFDKLTAAERRQICQIDDVCSCYRRDKLLKYKFASQVGYAEDLELGTRLVRDGYKIAQLYSTGVIHSHTRPATYFLKRTYVDIKTLSGLLGSDSTILKPYADWNKNDGGPVQSVLESIICLYNALSHAIDDLRNHAFHGGDISTVFSTIEAQMKEPRMTIVPKSNENELSKLLDQIASVARANLTEKPCRNVFGQRYIESISTFEEWMLHTRPSMTGLENDFVEALYKLLGIQIGTILAECFVSAQMARLSDERINTLDRFLSSDI